MTKREHTLPGPDALAARPCLVSDLLYPQERINLDLIGRARDAKVKTLVVSVDVPVNANRERNRRNGFTRPFRMTPAAMQMIPGVDLKLCRKPEILADAAWLILTSPSTSTGNFYIDDTLLAAHGVIDLDKYAVTPGNKNFIPDFFVD